MRRDLLILAAASLLSGGRAHGDEIRGVVQDSTGQPIFAARFDVFTPDGAKLPVHDNSDADGSYRLIVPAGRYDLACLPPAASGLAPHLQRNVSIYGITRLDWTPGPSVKVLGRVMGPDDNPVWGADLNFDRLTDGARQPALGDKTNLFGSFAAYLEPGEYRLTVTPPEGVDLAPVRLPFMNLPTRDTLRFTLVSASHLSGMVRDAAGAPQAGAGLSFERIDTGERVPSWGHETTADGSFRAGLAPETYRVLIRPPLGSRLVAQWLGPIDLSRDQIAQVVLQAGSLVSGRVFDRSHRPLTGASWSAWNESTQASVPTVGDNTDYDGQYRLALPTGLYRLTLAPPAGSGLDTLTFRDVRVDGDRVLDVDYGLSEIGTAELHLALLENPTHRRARLRMVLPSESVVWVEVFDVVGHRVRTLAHAWLPAGVHDG